MSSIVLPKLRRIVQHYDIERLNDGSYTAKQRYMWVCFHHMGGSTMNASASQACEQWYKENPLLVRRRRI